MNNFDPDMMNRIQQLVANNPQIATILQKPGMMEKLQQIASNPNDPNLAMQLASDPDLQQLMSILGGSGLGGMGGMGGLGGMGGFGGMGGMGDSGFPNPFQSGGYGANSEANGSNGNMGGNNANSGDNGKNLTYISSKGQFDDIIRNTKGKLIACDFYATWCGPCKVISPEFERLAKFYKNKAVFLKIDVDRTKDLSQACGIRAMPTFQFYKNGVKIDEFKGANTQKLNQLLEMHTYEPPVIRKLPYQFFPIKEDNRPVFAKQPPFDKVVSKLKSINDAMSDDKKLNDNDMNVLQEICNYLGAKSQWMSQTIEEKHFGVLSKALDWDSANVTLILDILRVLVLHPSVVDYFKQSANFQIIEKVFRLHCKLVDASKQSKNNAILACRIIINMFNKTGLHPMLRTNIGVIGNGLISCMTSEDSKVRLIFDKVLMQCSFILYNHEDRLLRANEENEKNANSESIRNANNSELIKITSLKIRCFSMLAEALCGEKDVSNILACLMSLGTLLFRDENVISFSKSIEFEMVLKQYNKRFGTVGTDEKKEDDGETKSPDISKCIGELLKAISNPKD